MSNLSYIYRFIALLAAISFFVPLFIVAYKKTTRSPFFVSFAAYWTWSGLVNLIFVSDVITNAKVLSVITRTYNLVDAPLLLCLLRFTLPSSGIKQKLKWFIPAYMAIEIACMLTAGLNSMVETMLVGAGIFTILTCIIGVVLFNLWKTKEQNPGSPKMFIYYALLFEYGVSVITFVFSYIFPQNNNLRDSFLVFHIATIITVLIAAYGLVSYSPGLTPKKQKPVKQKEREVEIRYL
ncbi:MAG: hypothetical protein KF862_05510 [Chitinophagaceae bacterium]|nr:hypothetical protein [Chitinophagaceae bacterium]